MLGKLRASDVCLYSHSFYSVILPLTRFLVCPIYRKSRPERSHKRPILANHCSLVVLATTPLSLSKEMASLQADAIFKWHPFLSASTFILQDISLKQWQDDHFWLVILCFLCMLARVTNAPLCLIHQTQTIQ